jgi:hypothetical protein
MEAPYGKIAGRLGDHIPIITNPDKWQIAEAIVNGYFPNLSAGIEINGKLYRFLSNNKENKYDIDWAVFYEKSRVAVIDTEYKPNWKYGKYPFWSVARYTYKYNKGDTNTRNETVKMHYYRQYPDLSFWMPIRADYKEAGIITGRKIIESQISFRPKPANFARDIEIYEFAESELIFCEILDCSIERYVINQLAQMGEFDE